MNNCGFDMGTAKSIEANYHKLYSVSDEWVADKLKQATATGYVEVAFGLRVRTPILSQVVMGQRTTPYEAMAEGRTAGNALGQSWGLLNNRAVVELMEKVYASEFKYDIHPVAQIHDASYYLCRNNPEALKFLNDNLIKAMQWQDDPAIYHPSVGLGGELEIYYPSWNDHIPVPNGASLEEIQEIVSAIKQCQELRM